ncbi:Docking protein 3 [Dissostichus eleginoides]|uniref:Docking protein 3 n=1 Tax=Dissostichus eleginoides TaxID=100907 RepID=A0AAD9CQV6_DISEL|nr:Docking protein 3 [Dissostichus eleginoides]
MEVVFKEGTLYLQSVKFGKKSWRKVWMVLFKPSSSGVGRFELSVLDKNSAADQRKVGRQKTPERKVVRLQDCLSFIPAPKVSCPSGCTAFSLHTAQCSFTLASTTSQDWLIALSLLAFQKDPGESHKGTCERGNGLTMEDNEIYSSWKTDVTLPPNHYQVIVQSTEASRRCRLAGKYLASPQKEALILLEISTDHIIYRWPYRFLRKFGHVEDGFSIEAGHHCESGEGVFTFLSEHGSQIFQAISDQCSMERRSSSKPHRSSMCELSTGILPTTTNCNEMLGEEGEEERCHSLDAVNRGNVMEDDIYYNVRRATLPIIRQNEVKPKMDPECIYAHVKKVNPPSEPQLQLLSSPYPQPPPCTFPQSVPYAPAHYQYQHQPSANDFFQPGYNAQAQAVDDMKETEEDMSSSTLVTPTEAPGSFKHRLAEILSKDLAKFQPPIPSGAGSPTFSH